MSSHLNIDNDKRKFLGTRKITLQDQSTNALLSPSSSSERMKNDNEEIISNHNALLVGFIVEKSCDNSQYSHEENSIHKHENFHLELLVTNGVSTFEGRIYAKDLKVEKILKKDMLNLDTAMTSPVTAGREALERVANYILQQPLQHKSNVDNITVTFSLLFQNSVNIPESLTTQKFSRRPMIEVIVREKILPSGVVRMIWKGCLLQNINNSKMSLPGRNNMMSTKINDNIDISESSLKFSMLLAQSLEVAHSDIFQKEKEKEELVSQVMNWKDTALKLENAWQRDKNELFENFLVLLNRVKADLRTARHELEQEKMKNNKLKDEAPITVLGSKDKTKSIKTEQHSRLSEVIDHPEEHDMLTFDPTEVDRLACGKPTTEIVIKKKYENVNKSSQLKSKIQSTTEGIDVSQLTDCGFNSEKDSSNNHSVLLSQEGHDAKKWSQTSLVRKNAYTGATEIFLDTNQCIESVTKKNSVSDMPTENRSKKRKLQETFKSNRESALSKDTDKNNQINNIKSSQQFAVPTQTPVRKKDHLKVKHTESKSQFNIRNNNPGNTSDSTSCQSSSDCDSEPLL